MILAFLHATMAKEAFSQARIFPYNHARKVFFGIAWILGIILLAGFVVSYFAIFKDSDFAAIAFFSRVIGHITSNVGSSTTLGIFYSTLIGGLFFIFMPLELLFIKFINTGHSAVLVITVYLAGIAISYTADYFIGLKFSFLAKKLISPRKFYKIKGVINRYGSIAVYLFNAVPLPSQVLSAILGVFKYNKTRFYVFVLLGQVTKLAAITIAIYYIL
jgi:membrane protein YqaA with SNARE-associated domain